MSTYEDFLEHHGIKGMKWGQRKGPVSAAGYAGTGMVRVQGHKNSKEGQALANLVGTAHNISSKDLPKAQADIARINAKYTDKQLQNDKIHAQYKTEIRHSFENHVKANLPEGLHATVLEHPSGNRPPYVVIGNKEGHDAEVKALKKEGFAHADTAVVHRFVLNEVTDDAGFITEIGLGDSVTHSGVALENFLEHHGVRGMKWGVRKDRSSGTARRTAPASTHDRALQPTTHTIPHKVEAGLSKKLAAKVVQPKEVSDDAAHHKELLTKVRTHGISSLSNTELKKFHERLDMEKKFSKFQEEQKAKKNSRTKKIMNKVLDQMAERALSSLAGHVVDAHVDKFKTGKTMAKMLPKKP